MEICSKTVNKYIKDYLHFCTVRKNLNEKTIKAYSIDLRQYSEFVYTNKYSWDNKKTIESYIEYLHIKYQPKCIKRKIASIKALFHYLETEELIKFNPFHKIQIKYKEPFILPKTIPLKTIESLIKYAYNQQNKQSTCYGNKIALRNTLIIELLFATGMRISELCSLTVEQINFSDYVIKIYGKGSRERLIQICNTNIQKLIDEYKTKFMFELKTNDYFFTNRLLKRLSEQSVRNMIKRYVKEAGIYLHITPHMFRHSFATQLLEEDVDIRYIQQMLGHSSITTTQIYTHTSISKQKVILTEKHPRNKISIEM